MSAREEFLMKSSDVTNTATKVDSNTYRNIHCPSVTTTPNNDIDYNNDRICNTCCKEDVCIYKGELAQAAKEITKISERENVFINTRIVCDKWLGGIINYR